MRAYLDLLRPGNTIMSGVAVGIGGVVAVGPQGVAAQWTAVALGMLAASVFTGAGNALNDYFDREVDRVNHPSRPIPAGRVEPRAALKFAVVLFAVAVAAGLFVNLAAFGLVLLSLALMIAYEVRFKSSGWSGNLLIAWLVGSLFLFAGLCVYREQVRPLQVAASLAVLAGLSTVGREVAKDIEDVAGDVGRTTLPKTRGIPFAARVSQGFTVAAVALSAVPLALGLLSVWYLPVVAAADAILIIAAFYSERSPGRSERLMKVGMAVALAAFLAGGIL
jgi:geranylgeranylglycerol-phosphate geranylgeranyltransferase